MAGGNTLQLTINSQPVFQNAIDSDNKILDQLSQVFPTPFKINSAMSSFMGQVNAAGAVQATQNRMTDKTCFGVGHPQTSLCGLGHYYGINLSKNEDTVNAILKLQRAGYSPENIKKIIAGSCRI